MPEEDPGGTDRENEPPSDELTGSRDWGGTLTRELAGTLTGELSWTMMTGDRSMDRTDDFDSLGDGYWNRTEDFDSLGDGYYTRQEIQELAKLVAREREEQRHVELSTEHLRKWIKCAAPCPPRRVLPPPACVRLAGGRGVAGAGAARGACTLRTLDPPLPTPAGGGDLRAPAV